MYLKLNFFLKKIVVALVIHVTNIDKYFQLA